MMSTETIITTLLRAASSLKEPIGGVVSQSLKDAYDATKRCLARKLSTHPDAADALEKATAKPESDARRDLLCEEAESLGLDDDVELVRLVTEITSLLPPDRRAVRQNVRVSGRGNRVFVAGRNLTLAERSVRRNVIVPDDRHLNPDQREKLRGLLAELAVRLAGEDGRPNFAAAHRILQRRFSVVSYLLIPGERFGDAVAFLKRQRAIHRHRLQKRNPELYGRDLHRAIYARAHELGWDRARVFAFAEEKLQFKRPLVSLKDLGPIQLKSLADCLQRAAANGRATKTSTTADPAH